MTANGSSAKAVAVIVATIGVAAAILLPWSARVGWPSAWVFLTANYSVNASQPASLEDLLCPSTKLQGEPDYYVWQNARSRESCSKSVLPVRGAATIAPSIVVYAVHQTLLVYLLVHRQPHDTQWQLRFNVINLVFIAIHVTRSYFQVGALTQIYSTWSSMASVTAMLTWAVLIEAKDYGIILGIKLGDVIPCLGKYDERVEEASNLARKWHGLYFVWALVFTMHSHPAFMAVAHLTGMIYVTLLLVHAATANNRLLHKDPFIITLVHVGVCIHGSLTALTTNDQWPMFLSGFTLVLALWPLPSYCKQRWIDSSLACQCIFRLLPLAAWAAIWAAIFVAFALPIGHLARGFSIVAIYALLLAALVWLLPLVHARECVHWRTYACVGVVVSVFAINLHVVKRAANADGSAWWTIGTIAYTVLASVAFSRLDADMCRSRPPPNADIADIADIAHTNSYYQRRCISHAYSTLPPLEDLPLDAPPPGESFTAR